MSGFEFNCQAVRSGADKCSAAAETASEGASKLAAHESATGIFGDFAEAHSFHATLRGTHNDHVDLLKAHQQQLTAIHRAAAAHADTFDAR